MLLLFGNNRSLIDQIPYIWSTRGSSSTKTKAYLVLVDVVAKIFLLFRPTQRIMTCNDLLSQKSLYHQTHCISWILLFQPQTRFLFSVNLPTLIEFRAKPGTVITSFNFSVLFDSFSSRLKSPIAVALRVSLFPTLTCSPSVAVYKLLILTVLMDTWVVATESSSQLPCPLHSVTGLIVCK